MLKKYTNKPTKRNLIGGEYIGDQFCSQSSEDLAASTAENDSMGLNSLLESAAPAPTPAPELLTQRCITASTVTAERINLSPCF